MEKKIRFQLPKLGFFCAVILGTWLIISPYLARCETTPEQKLECCSALTAEASEMAFKAQVTHDYPMANRALSLVEEAAYLVSQVCRLAQDRTDQSLAFSAYSVTNEVKAAIGSIVQAAQHIASKSPDPEVVHAANFLLESCELVQKQNGDSMEMALAPMKGTSKKAEVYSKR